MATSTYTCRFSSELAFNAHPSAAFGGISQSIPADAVIQDARFSVYCGVGQYNITADTNMTLTDNQGAAITINSSCWTGSENRLWAVFGGSPSGALNWNTLTGISLSGTSRLTVRTGYDATLTITWIQRTAVTSPSSVSVAPLSEGDVTLSWSGAKNGSSNSITGYEIQFAESADGQEYGAWATLKTITATAASGSVPCAIAPMRGHLRKYRMLAKGQYINARDWSPETGACRHNRLPVSPAEFRTDSPTITQAPASIALSWAGQSDPDGNLRGVVVSFRVRPRGGDWPEAWTALGEYAASGATHTVSLQPGEAIQYRCIAVDAFDVYAEEYSGHMPSVLRKPPPIAAAEWTDDPILSRGTLIRAVHMTEIRAYINLIRENYALAPYSWKDEIVPGTTSMLGWEGHVREMRTAIDDVAGLLGMSVAWRGMTHAQPGADVMTQLRKTVEALL